MQLPLNLEDLLLQNFYIFNKPTKLWSKQNNTPLNS